MPTWRACSASRPRTSRRWRRSEALRSRCRRRRRCWHGSIRRRSSAPSSTSWPTPLSSRRRADASALCWTPLRTASPSRSATAALACRRRCATPSLSRSGKATATQHAHLAGPAWAWASSSSLPRCVAVPAEATTEQALALVVEDNAEMRHFIVQTLAATYRTVTAVDGQDGLEKALTLRPDVILSDMMMPRMSGEHFVRAVRAQPDLDGVPIIILTARSDEELRARLLSEGAQDYLVKPFATAELRARVGNLITMKRTRDVLQQDLAGQRRGLEDLAREVTARRQEVETANRAKDEFLSHAAHELKTPLAALLGHLELAERYVRRALAHETMDAATVAGTLARVQRFHQRADVPNSRASY